MHGGEGAWWRGKEETRKISRQTQILPRMLLLMLTIPNRCVVWVGREGDGHGAWWARHPLMIIKCMSKWMHKRLKI